MSHDSLQAVDHRPWPLSKRPWVGRQRWYNLLFAHWPVAAESIQRHLPAELKVQQFDGSAWLGVVPFKMSGIAARGGPAIPGLSAFPELNVRTYVEIDGKPGVWFFSLDATNWLAVWCAQRFFHLPYHRAAIDVHPRDGGFEYISQRRDEAAEFRGHYRPTGAEYEAERGSLDHFLTERYCLYCQHPLGEILRGEIHHRPWRLQQAAATIDVNTMTDRLEIPLQGQPLLHYSAGVDAIVWFPAPLNR